MKLKKQIMGAFVLRKQERQTSRLVWLQCFYSTCAGRLFYFLVVNVISKTYLIFFSFRFK